LDSGWLRRWKRGADDVHGRRFLNLHLALNINLFEES
jgi:hypothetical protein